MGVYLKEITAETTDQDWNKKFMDRTVKENKLKPINKIIKLN